MCRTLGTAVFAGMIGVTQFGILLTPVFYSAVPRFSDRGPGDSGAGQQGSPGRPS
jgi:hypothetical protein